MEKIPATVKITLVSGVAERLEYIVDGETPPKETFVFDKANGRYGRTTNGEPNRDNKKEYIFNVATQLGQDMEKYDITLIIARGDGKDESVKLQNADDIKRLSRLLRLSNNILNTVDFTKDSMNKANQLADADEEFTPVKESRNPFIGR